MKSGASSLNPYAASYVPLFKRGVADVNKEFNSGNEAVQYGHQRLNAFPHNVSQSYGHSAGPVQTAEFSKWNDHHGSEFVASTSQYPNEMPEKANFHEDSDMDLAYLQMIFPGISEDSLSDVYLANRCDLDAAVDMLNQLEIHPYDSSDKLPDTLDIGDVPESGSTGSQEVKKTTGEAGASTSASSNMLSKS